MRQETLTVVARVGDATGALAALAELEADRWGSGSRYFQPRVFADSALSIHFARLVFVAGDRQAGTGDALVFESNFDTVEPDEDRAQSRHLEALAEREYSALAAVFRACERFPLQAEPARLAGYLRERRVSFTASYQGHTERDLERIRLERALREAVLSFMERAPRGGRAELYAQVRAYLRLRAKTDPDLRGLDIDGPAPKLPSGALRSARLKERIGPWLRNIGPALPLLAEVPRILGWDHTDAIFDLRARQEAWNPGDRRLFSAIAASEDHGVQNALTHVATLRAGERRQHVLRTAHAYIDRMAKAHFDGIGQLGGIPSIHFAKWLMLDEGRRLLFFSNYDSSWESYLGDFVDQAAVGLNLAWSCLVEAPPTGPAVQRVPPLAPGSTAVSELAVREHRLHPRRLRSPGPARHGSDGLQPRLPGRLDRSRPRAAARGRRTQRALALELGAARRAAARHAGGVRRHRRRRSRRVAADRRLHPLAHDRRQRRAHDLGARHDARQSLAAERALRIPRWHRQSAPGGPGTRGRRRRDRQRRNPARLRERLRARADFAGARKQRRSRRNPAALERDPRATRFRAQRQLPGLSPAGAGRARLLALRERGEAAGPGRPCR